jgi:hypothetical protein
MALRLSDLRIWVIALDDKGEAHYVFIVVLCIAYNTKKWRISLSTE